MEKSNKIQGEIKLQLLKVQEIGCNINTNVLASEAKIDFDKIQIQFGFKNDFNLKEDIYNLTVFVRYVYNLNDTPTIIVELITENRFKVIDLKDHIELKDNEFQDKANLLPTLFGISISTLRGILVVKTAGTFLADFPLPVVNPTEILSALIDKKANK